MEKKVDATESRREFQSTMQLSHAQLSIWLGQERHPHSPLYNMGMLFEIEGELDLQRFARAFTAFVNANDVMRSVVTVDNGSPRVGVLKQLDFEIDFRNFTKRVSPAKSCRQFYESVCGEIIDLSKNNFVVSVGKISEDSFVWFLNQHHLFTDIASLELIFRDVGDRYRYQDCYAESDINGNGADAMDIASPHKAEGSIGPQSDAARQNDRKITLYGVTPSDPESKALRIEGRLGEATKNRLASLMQAPDYKMLNPGLTRYCLMSSGIAAYLSRISETMSLTMACPTPMRGSQAEKNSLGLFIEMQSFEVTVEEGDTFETLYPRVQHSAMEYLKGAATGDQDRARLRSINVVWNLIQTRFGEFAGIPARTRWLHNGHIDSQHDLRIQLLDLNGLDEWDLYFDVNSAVFDQGSGITAMSHFCYFLDQFFHHPGVTISALPLAPVDEQLSLVERSQAFLEANAEKPVPDIVTVLERHARVTPEAIAASVGEMSINYVSLHIESDRLAKRLADADRGSGMVGICAPRSIELLIAIVAVLKTGSSYIPLDPKWPIRRIEKLCRFAEVDAVISVDGSAAGLTDHLAKQLEGLSCDQLQICFEQQRIVWNETGPVAGRNSQTGSVAAALTDIQLEDPAYTIFTSGSTGEPKGVVVTHGALTAYVSWAAETYVTNQQCGDFALHSSIGFDLTITSIFVPLWLGATVHIYPEGAGMIDLSVLDAVNKDQAGVLKLTPAHLALVIEANISAKNIHTLILGGENLPVGLARRAREVFGNDIRVMNEYGPTEAVVGCMWHEFDPDTDRGVSVPIGLPARNSTIYLLDDAGNPVPDGVVGEIFVGGTRLARGYMKDSALTDQKFIPDRRYKGQRVYRTGDLARFELDGKMVYLGRKDTQVKIRGARIEVEEVSATLLRHEDVTDCRVLAVSGAARHENKPIQHCRVCGLASNYPGTMFDSTGRCNICQDFERHRDRALGYFKDLPDFRKEVSRLAENKNGDYDCLVLLSGGKDSTYALYNVAQMGFNVFAMTLDNGYISDGAKRNIRRSVEDLNIDHEFLTVDRMNEIFSDSLQRHNSVCYGCFKTIYTLAINMAHKHGIPIVVTGLSRGQFFETRLTSEILEQGAINPEKIDLEVLENRKIYHRIPDKVTEVLDTTLFDSDAIFEQVSFVDFYRYCDVSMDEMYDFLERQAPWTRPEDTGRSTNCLINDTGIHVHKQRLGYHNYALPYSWDVRLGHKNRDEALDELNDRIDVDRVSEILQEVGFHEPDLNLPADQPRLVAYYTCKNDPGADALRSFVSERLSDAMVPTYFVAVDDIPLTGNGKVDTSKLPDPRYQRPKLKAGLVLPATETERRMSNIWQKVLRLERIGVHDNFFELGGDSIVAIQIVAAASNSGMRLTPNQIFQYPTVAELSAHVPADIPEETQQPEVHEAFSLLDQESMEDISTLIDR